MNIDSQLLQSRNQIVSAHPVTYPIPDMYHSTASPPLITDGSYSHAETPPVTAVGYITQGIQKGLSMMGFPIRVPSPDSTDGTNTGAKSISSIVLSLKTLGSLTLSSSNILPLLMSSVLPYFDSPDYKIRREAAVTCTHMLSLAMIKSSLISPDQDCSGHLVPPNAPPYGATVVKISRSASVGSNSSSLTDRRHSIGDHVGKERKNSNVSTGERISPDRDGYIAPKPLRIDTNMANSATYEDFYASGTGTLGMGRSSAVLNTARDGRNYLLSRQTTPSVDRLGGRNTPGLVFSSKRYINNKSIIYTRGPAAIAIDSIMIKLLHIVVSDPHEEVRRDSLRCILDSPIFDSYLSRKYHIDSLLFLLADEVFEIRMDALTILGRLALINPALVLPPLRILLIRLISEISNSADNRLKEEAILMVCRFLNSASLHTFVKSYVGTLIKILPLTSDVRLTTASLACIGEICKVMRQDMSPYFNDLLPIIVTNMHDHTSRRKQEIAISTLGLLVASTGRAVEPYLKYPQLLPRALDLLFKSSVNTPWSLRMETLRCIGLLGALEPQKYSMIINYLQLIKDKKLADKGTPEESNAKRRPSTITSGISSSYALKSAEYRDRADSLNLADTYAFTGSGRKSKSGSENEPDLIKCDVLLDDDNSDQAAHYLMYEQSVMRSVSAPTTEEVKRRTPHNDDYYPHITISALMKMLHERSLSVHHSSVAQAIMVIFKSLGMKSVPFLEEIVPYLLHLMRTCGPGLRESLLQQFSFLVSIVQYHITAYLPAIFEVIHDFWYEHIEQVITHILSH